MLDHLEPELAGDPDRLVLADAVDQEDLVGVLDRLSKPRAAGAGEAGRMIDSSR